MADDLLREKWLPDSRPLGAPDLERIIQENGSGWAKSLRTLRTELGLDRPYGTKARELKLGELAPVGRLRPEETTDPSEPDALDTPEDEFSEAAVEEAAVEDLAERLPGDAATVEVEDLPF